MRKTMRHQQYLGLALGSGSARGWAHIGVIRALTDMGIMPGIMCGSSAGALVGGTHAAGYLDEFEKWLRTLTRKKVVAFFDITMKGGGIITGDRLFDFFRERFGDRLIESLPITFGAVATNLETGNEVWLRSGSLFEAIRASLSMPGIFTPVLTEESWFVDGGLVNPVPVSLCRALGAQVVIAVNLNGRLVGKRFLREETSMSPYKTVKALAIRIRNEIKGNSSGDDAEFPSAAVRPGLFDVVSGALNIMQDRITRSRIAGDPPDIVLSPRLEHLGLLEFHRVSEAVEEGRRCVQEARQAIESVVARL
ncbi:MAG: patatin-like phospholipase family protein [Deltaproteobacteria bacterium]|nr:patatin-like phospholipase family protein [Deltaproteobacteria bacterium]